MCIIVWPCLQVVYERALAAFPVTHYLWAQYARYLEAHLKIGSGAAEVELLARSCSASGWMGPKPRRHLCLAPKRSIHLSGSPS